ncbi:hypothetical protein CE122_000685 [Candidatus Sulcia muelleri]|uniref:hypothetical protein n=1 Tax=Candidatus Karelsulcia muelleri TaxID=336810 RepID=UPI001953C079|nr:hypothetical protein [Candidatus Karelsulcia muelleri]NHU72476.1 hypothetical protein [Candidatus Karelsulcia muelleri]
MEKNFKNKNHKKKTIQKEKKSLKKMTKIIFFLKKKNNYSFKEKIINSNLIVHWVNDRN